MDRFDFFDFFDSVQPSLPDPASKASLLKQAFKSQQLVESALLLTKHLTAFSRRAS